MYNYFICVYSQDLLTRHKVLVAEHLEQNYDAVSDRSHTRTHIFPNIHQENMWWMTVVATTHVCHVSASGLPSIPDHIHATHPHTAPIYRPRNISHWVLFGSININTVHSSKWLLDPKREKTHRYITRSGISHLSSQWPSHISPKKYRVCLIELTLVRKEEIKFRLSSVPGRVNQWKALCVTTCLDTKLCSVLSSFPRQRGPFHRKGPRGSQAEETGHKTAFLPGRCMLTDVTVKPVKRRCCGLNRVDVMQEPVTGLSQNTALWLDSSGPPRCIYRSTS